MCLLFTLISNGFIGYMPPIEELQNPRNKFATEIYSSDMQLLGRYFQSKENRVNVNYSEISPNAVNALVATEDARFKSHSGIDGLALTRSILLRGILHRKSAGGGSTITQQLAKQLWSPRAESFMERLFQKPIEWTIAAKLEKYYTKEEIVTMYLNQFDFLYNAVGIKSAAQVYFSTTPDKLTIEQAATLIGMCKNPSYFNPMRQKDRAMGRRNVVLNQMRKADYITEGQYDSLCKIPLTTKFQSIDHKSGPAPYFREYLRLMLTANKPDRSNYAEWQLSDYKEDSLSWETNPVYGFCEKYKKPDGSKYNIYTDGLKIYTTIDSRMQKYAEEAVDEHIQSLQKKFFDEKKGRSYAPFSRLLSKEQITASMDKSMRQSDRYIGMKQAGASDDEIKQVFNTKIPMRVFSYTGTRDTVMSPLDSIRYQKYFLRCGFMSMNPYNGQVKAYVGGPNFSQFQYDMVSKGRRQVGSTIKPYLYTLAMEEGMSPCDLALNAPHTLQTGTGTTWTPKNGSKTRMGEMVTLRWGLANSNNWISAYVMSLFTPQALVKLMHSFGIQEHIDPVVSLCLGPVEIKVAEMVDAYTTFANKGLRVEPQFVTRIEDGNGNIIASFTPKMKEVISENTAYKMIYMLQAVVNEGTAQRLRSKYGLTGEICGKTGTTQNNSDGWFMGFTPSLVSGGWVGGEDRGIHFDGTADGQGASMALPIWALYMKKIYADPSLGYSQSERFEIPQNFKVVNGCLQEGEAADKNATDEILN
ncbi:MAG: transglycosylase domain-containing protein [Paludibacteraceae bacterium]|nr:transglycosylase domain-containing protein [Paludibacteraceae bacterium]